MKDFLLFIGTAISLKFIEDNLPDLHYKKVLRYLNEFITPLFFILLSGFIYLQMKLSNNKEHQKQLQETLSLITIFVILIAVARMWQKANTANEAIKIN